MARRRGLIARALHGRIDKTVLSDGGVLVGLLMAGYGIWQFSAPAAWLFAGAAVVAASVIAVLPSKVAPPKGDR